MPKPEDAAADHDSSREDLYDLVVLGSGVAASRVAHRCRAAGWRVAIVDREAFGGTCALRGCDPKKVLLGVADVVDGFHRLKAKGIGGEARVDWAQLQAFKRTFTDPVPESRAKEFAEQGIEAYRAQARFTGPGTLAIGARQLRARHIVIATGAVPRPLGICGEEHLATSTDFLELAELPRRVVLVGGGYIAAEFSHLAARAGAEVVILEQGERLLTQFDPDLVGVLTTKMAHLGIDIRLHACVEAIEKAGGALEVTATARDGRIRIPADLVVHAAGRGPDLQALDLKAGRVEVDRYRIKLNPYLQSVSNSAVYAAGDAAAVGPPLTPVAGLDGAVVADNLLQGNHRETDCRGTPSVAFTIPPLARVGLLEEQARLQQRRFRCRFEQTGGWYTARRVGEDCAGFKLLVEEGSERILGAHLLGPGADEVINLFGLAIRHGLTASQLRSSIYAYPTAASDIGYML